ncbi:hypothetical protein [Caldisericum sp.]|uniref:hypothetical protein n=1 Tax=Caldisericum sp. TaxID=2499687 RepID=UPI003D149E00
MIKQTIKILTSCFAVAFVLASITFLITYIIYGPNLISLLNTYFFEGSLLIVISGILSLGNLGEKVPLSKIYFQILKPLFKETKLDQNLGSNSWLLLFLTGLYIYGFMFLIHIIFKPTF